MERVKKEITSFGREIIFCVGMPASGKSTFAKKWVAEHPEDRYRFNNDDILKSMTGGHYSKQAYLAIRDMQSGLLKYAIQHGVGVVLDNTHMNPFVLDSMFKLVTDLVNEHMKETGVQYKVTIADFTDVPIEVCKERNRLRESPMPETEYDKFYSDITSIKELIRSYKDAELATIYNMKFIQTDNE